MTAIVHALDIFDSALQERQPVATKLLTAALSRRALSNSYLFTGRAIADKWLIAQQVAAFLNCLTRQSHDHFSCLSKVGKSKNLNLGQTASQSDSADTKAGQTVAQAQQTPAQSSSDQALCQNCRWIQQQEHPQAWLLLEGKGESGMIPVERARLLTDELSKTSQYMRVVIVPRSEQNCLHAAPANALLKNIEEPHDGSLFILFAASAEQVLPTIISRSQVVPFLSHAKPGYWSPVQAQAEGEDAHKFAENLASVKSEFIHSARNRLSGTSSLHGSFLKAVSESQDLAERLRVLTEDETLDAEILIDLLMSAELEVLRDVSSRNSAISIYLSKMIELSENSKSQLDHYVRNNNVLETFAYSLTELRSKYLGDFCLAKK